MPDSKITALTSISTSTDPANDPLVIVDVSDTSMAATGTTKKVTLNQLLGASGTATLASATISGDLTVDTSTLKVTASTDTVTVGATTTDAKFRVVDASYNGLRIGFLPGTANYNLYDATVHEFRTANVTPQQLYTLQASSSVWYDGAGGTRMTLNSTGLGVGVSPSYKLDASATTNLLRLTSANGNDCNIVLTQSGVGNWMLYNAATNGQLRFQFGGNDRMIIDTSGNVGIGVTPSAWGGSYKALQLQSVARNIAATGAGSGDLTVAFNAIYDSTDSRWEYAGTGDKAGRYSQTGSGNHRWFVSNTAGTAGNEITDFASAAMTLDASGNLLVGTTGQNGSWNTKLTLSNDSGTTKWAVGPYLGGVTNFIISAGASTGVYLNGTAATSWTSASDERLKDIIEPISNAIAKVGSLRAVIGKFKFDENNTRKPFLIAQDIQAVLPEAVDASNPDKLGVAYTDVIPLLVAAIKELTAEVNALKNT